MSFESVSSPVAFTKHVSARRFFPRLQYRCCLNPPLYCACGAIRCADVKKFRTMWLVKTYYKLSTKSASGEDRHFCRRVHVTVFVRKVWKRRAAAMDSCCFVLLTLCIYAAAALAESTAAGCCCNAQRSPATLPARFHNRVRPDEPVLAAAMSVSGRATL